MEAHLTLWRRYATVIMSTLQEAKQVVTQLTPEELAAFRTWFAEFDAEQWDLQLEEDVAAGKLDYLAEKALKHLRKGDCTDL